MVTSPQPQNEARAGERNGGGRETGSNGGPDASDREGRVHITASITRPPRPTSMFRRGLSSGRWYRLYSSRRAAREAGPGATGDGASIQGQPGDAAVDAHQERLEKLRRSARSVAPGLSDSRIDEMVAGKNRATAEVSAALAQAHREAKSAAAAGGAMNGAGSRDRGAGVVEDIAKEDTAIRARACRELVEQWWERLLGAAKDCLSCREAELEEHR